jgi:hypothetical protein
MTCIDFLQKKTNTYTTALSNIIVTSSKFLSQAIVRIGALNLMFLFSFSSFFPNIVYRKLTTGLSGRVLCTTAARPTIPATKAKTCARAFLGE